MRCLALILFVSVATSAFSRNDAAIAAVEAGTSKEARADWWGFDEKDATAALQAAIKSKASRVVVPHLGKPWVVRPIKLRSDLELVFEKGVVLEAKRGEFKDQNSSLLAGANVKNVTIVGNSATLRMWKADYQKPPYAKSEWRHALSFHGSENVTLTGLTVQDSGGDGVYLGTGASGGCKRFTIRQLQCTGHHRQGISVINAEHLLIEDCAFNDTSGTAPMAGIDFEPNEPNEKLTDCVLRRCTFNHNAAYGVLFALGRSDVTTEPISITLEDCQVRSNRTALMFAMKNPAGVRGEVSFKRCVFADSTQDGAVLRTKTLPGPKLVFDQCQFIHLNASKDTAPISILSRGEQGDPMGGVHFNDCIVEDDADRKPISYDDVGGLRLQDITGRITVKHSGRSTVHELNDQIISQWFPWTQELKSYQRHELKLADLVPAATPPRRVYPALDGWLRGDARFVVYAKQGETVEVNITSKIVSTKAPAKPIEVKLVLPNGKTQTLREVVAGTSAPCSFKAGAAGIYELVCHAGPQAVSIGVSGKPVCAVSPAGAMHFIGTTGLMHFLVPAGVKEFAIRVAGDGGMEQARAIIADSDGRVVLDVDNISRSKQLTVQRVDASHPEVWSLQLAQPQKAVIEDVQVMFDGVPAVIASSPEALLVIKGTAQSKFRSSPRIAIIGDSTVASYPNPPKEAPTLTGWGQVLDQFMARGVVVDNQALSGRSSRSFLLEGHWQNVISGPADYVLIQFGHNDGKSELRRHTDAGSTYDETLRGYIHQARSLGIKPVLVTPVARMIFEKDGKVTTLLDAYSAAMKRVAETDKAPLVDLHDASKAMLEKMGPKATAKFQSEPKDHTHFSREGALAMAKLVANGLKQAVPELAEFLK